MQQMDLLNSILDNMDDAFIISDDAGKILLLNKSAVNLTEKLLNKSVKVNDNLNYFIEALHPDSNSIVLNDLIQSLQVQKTFSNFVNQRGITQYLEFTYLPLIDEKGKLKYIHTTIQDKTTQKVFEQKVTTLTSDMGNILEMANAIIVELDTSGYITFWNRRCSKVSGYRKNEVYTKRFTDVLIAEKDREAFDSIFADMLGMHSKGMYEIKAQTKEGKHIILLLNGTLRKSSNNTTVGVVLIGQDATELIGYRNSLEEQVEERTYELQKMLNKEKEVVEMKSRFVSIASHEFRTPLASIGMATKTIEKNYGKLSVEQVKAKLAKIEEQVQHMSHLLDDVLTYGKNEAAKIQLQTKAISLEDFISKIVEDVGHATKHSHNIKLKTEKIPQVIITDEKLLLSIIGNLLTNAIKFSPNNDHIILEAKWTDNHLIFNVQDFGLGIADDEQEKIFEPFLRGIAGNSIQGTGLGLTIVKKAVTLLQGSIDLQSQPGKGTTFTVTIPDQIK